MTENEISKVVVDRCYKIHTTLGPGLYESVYENVLSYELRKSGLRIKRQQIHPVIYDDIKMKMGFRTDIIIENKVILELKSVENLSPVYSKQLLTYLKLSGMKLGLLINFSVPLIKNGIHRIVNNL